MMRGIGSKVGFRMILLSIIGSAVLFVLYGSILQPLFLVLFPRKDIYHGLLYYKDESYLAFENGKDFQEFLLEYEQPGKGNVVDFYYFDNHRNDTLFYGKASSIYILEVEMQPDEYTIEKEKQINLVSFQASLEDFLLCAIPIDNPDANNVKVLGFCDAKCIVRYIMITNDNSTHSVVMSILNGSDCNWSAEGG